MRAAAWAAAAWLRRRPGGDAVLALAAIDGPEERARLPDEAIDALRRSPGLLVPLLALARARRIEPSSASRIARAFAADGRLLAAERVVRAAMVHFAHDPSLRRDRLRLLVALASPDLAAYAVALTQDPDLDGETAFEVWALAHDRALAGNPLAPALEHEAAARIAQLPDDGAGALVRARRARRLGDIPAVLAHVTRATEAEPPPAGLAAALADACDLALYNNLWPDAVPLFETASRLHLPVARGPEGAMVIALARAGRIATPVVRHAIVSLPGAPATLPPPPADAPVMMVANGLGCGGMERVLAGTIAGLRQRGREVRLATYPLTDPDRFFLSESGVDEASILSLGNDVAPPSDLLLAPRHWRATAAALRAIIVHHRPSLVHAWNDRLGLIAAIAALPVTGTRLVVHLHHMRPTRDRAEAEQAAGYPPGLAALAARPDVRFVFCAAAARRDYVDWLDAPDAGSFKTILNGFPDTRPATSSERAAARARFGLPPEAPVIASLFRFEAVKQPLLWLDAASAIAAARPDACFLMAGDGELLAAAQARAAAPDLVGRVHFAGRIADRDALLAASDLVMMSSASEGLPNGAVEAQLAGVPVVAFDVGGTRETIEPTVTGRLVAANHVAALAAAAVDWLNAPAARLAAGRAAQARAATLFSMERYLDDLDRLYAWNDA